MAPRPDVTTMFTGGRRIWNNITSFIGCCKRDKSCLGDEVVVKTGFDSDVMQMAIDEVVVKTGFDNDMIQMATDQEEEIYLSDDENDESGEIYLSDEEDAADTYEDGRKERNGRAGRATKLRD